MPTLYGTSSTISISPDGVTWTPIATLDGTNELSGGNKVTFKLHMNRKQRIALLKLVGVPHGFRRASRRAQKRGKIKQHRM